MGASWRLPLVSSVYPEGFGSSTGSTFSRWKVPRDRGGLRRPNWNVKKLSQGATDHIRYSSSLDSRNQLEEKDLPRPALSIGDKVKVSFLLEPAVKGSGPKK